MTTTDTIAREIKYSRQDRDYACYVEGQYIGSRANYSDAETLCDQVAYDLIADGQCATAAELDADSDIDTIAAEHAACPTCEGEGRIPAGGWGDQAGGYAQTCPDCESAGCTRAAERLIIDAFMTRLRFDAGVLCSFCGDEHADSACPQKRPLLAPRVCGNCGGQHSIQQCSDIRRLLFAA